MGTTLVLAAITVGVAIWQSNMSRFTALPGFWVAVGVGAVGVFLAGLGTYKRDGAEPSGGMTQQGGDHAKMYQAGRDVRAREGGRQKE